MTNVLQIPKQSPQRRLNDDGAGGNTTLTVFTLSLSEEIFMCKVVFIFAKIPYKQNIIYLVIFVTDVRVPIRCMHMQVDLSRVDLTFAQGKKDVCNFHL